MLRHEKLRHSCRRLHGGAPLAQLDRVPSSSRRLLAMAMGAGEGDQLYGGGVDQGSSLSLMMPTHMKVGHGHGHSRGASSRVWTLLKSVLSVMIPSSLPPLPCLSWALAAFGMEQQHVYSSSSLGSKVTGTLFGHRRGHVFFAVQDDPRRQPALLLELATSTSTLVKEMASGLVRIALECERRHNRDKLLLEPMWTMYCNGRKSGYAIRRACSDIDLQVLTFCQAISMGAGVLPATSSTAAGHHHLHHLQDGHGCHDGELTYMRAKFQRVVGSKDSEAFYMMSPDRHGSTTTDLSIFLLRI
ncbi:hypothetical protein GOP47_0009983 [Adiantum capillus-veneris]|uniref:Protein MIZU-KUSSEI 1 n=1 Tax=Adiantum capillus-veneris TaxID=13818 RepID=A0A9D4ZJ83_ADICA|nr:hypothetical protein GOP47_0009983 [Adiantum capillus-veneris]